MQGLLEKIKLRLHWIVFLLLEAVSLVLLFRFNAYQSSVWFTKANQAAAWVNEREQRVLAYLHLGQTNQQLTRENLLLQYNLMQLRQELAYLKHDSTLTERKVKEQIFGIEQIAAQVTDNSVSKRDNILVINRGSADGVKPEQGVVSGTGVVGIVNQVGRHYSTVLPVLHSKSSISCRIRGTEYFGYLKWNGGSPLKAVLTDVPHHARLKEGDIVETSGYSNVFPTGIFVGRVIKIADSEDGLAFLLHVQLSTDFSRLRDVIILNNTELEPIREVLSCEKTEEEPS